MAVLTSALNEFNHAVQRFATVSEYEAARSNYCEDIVEREAMVEDAITGNMLRIKDQTLHVSTATDVQDNHNVPPEWRVDDVRDLVTLMLVPSPQRPNGQHSAQPTLVRAGPGTGKTWMTKQAVYTLADKLKANVGPGIRLVPIVVFVQRIVFLIREGHAGGLLQVYIDQNFPGKKYESWRKMLVQAYEMRALVVLIDGVDEAAGLRDEIETFIHNDLVPSGNRLLVTSRPEGVTIRRYMGRFVIMNLNDLTNEQQRKVINIQMNGSIFFDHLLSLGEVRKQLDDAYAKLRESIQGELETLYSPDRFKKKARADGTTTGRRSARGSARNKRPDAADEDPAPPPPTDGSRSEMWDPEERQKTVRGDRVIEAKADRVHDPTQAISSNHLQMLDRQLNAISPQRCGEPLLERLDTVVKKLKPNADKMEFQAAVLEDMLGPNNEIEVRHRVAVELGLMLRRLRTAAGLVNPIKMKRTKSSVKDESGVKGDGKASAVAKGKGKPTSVLSAVADEDKVADKAKTGADAATKVLFGKAGLNLSDLTPDDAPGEKRSANDLNGVGAATRLWAKIVSRTDELYTVAEKLQSTFENAMRRLAKEAGRDSEESASLESAVTFAELKSPVRAHEKAMDEYKDRFPDGALPEACLTDVLRCRMSFATGSQCISVITRLLNGVVFGDDAKVDVQHDANNKGKSRGMLSNFIASAPAEASSVQNPLEVTMMNLFNRYAELDPTHFRAHVLTLKISYKGVVGYCEAEVHYSEIMKVGLSENANAYEHYNFFRQRLAGTVPEAELDSLLEEKLIFLVDATGIPVLLSLLVLIFTAGGEDLTKLPSNRIELYELGIESAINKRLQRGQPAKGDSGPMIYDQLVRHWMRLFNLDRSNMSVEDNPQFETKKEREHRPTRKTAMKFEDLRNSAEHSFAEKRMQETAEKQQGDQKQQSFKLDSKESYEVFKHAAHYLREANKPEVQRTELNRIELSMPKKLVDTVMTLVNANLKLLLGGTAPAFGLTMLRNVAVTNQQSGRREFSSGHVSAALLLEFPTPEGFTLWVHLNKEEAGLPLIKTLEAQTEVAPAQYQFKHLSFQEGLFAQHLLIQAEAGWDGWATDEAASAFINNPFMNNTCRIAAGHLGTLLSKRRPFWDFSKSKLDEVGLQALWLLMDRNERLTKLSLKGNRVGGTVSDSHGVARMLTTSTALNDLNLASNVLGSLKQYLRPLARGLSANKTLTNLDVSSNELWPEGTKIMCNALKSCTAMRKVDISYNHPGREPSLGELLRIHPTLTSVGVVEAEPTTRIERSFHLDSRGKESIGRALLDSPFHLQYLQCDAFKLTEETTKLVWNSNVQCDAVVLAGVLKKNTVLTTLNVVSGKGEMGDYEREEVGKALLANKRGKLGYCDIYSMNEDTKDYSCDLRDKEHIRSLRSYTLFVGLVRANPTITSLTLKSLSAEHVDLLGEAMRHNSTLKELKLEHPTKGSDMTVARLPVQKLNGTRKLKSIDLTDAGKHIVSKVESNSHVARFACAMIGAILAENMTVETLKINPGPTSDGGAVLEHLNRANKSSLRVLDLTGIGLGDRGGAKLFEGLQTGLCANIQKFMLASNGLADHAIGPLMVEVLRNDYCNITSLDLSENNVSGAVLARAIQLNRSLTSLDVRKNPLDDQALWVLGGLLLGEACMCRIASIRTYAFEVEEGARVLDLHDKALEGGAVRLLAGIIKFNTSLEDVNLAGCGVGAAATPAIAQAITYNRTLTSINLHKNPMCDGAQIAADDKGLVSLAEAVRWNTALKQLTLEGGELSITSLKGIVEKREVTKKSENHHDLAAHCKAIDLSSQNLNLISGSVIASLVKENTLLTELQLQMNDLGPEGMTTIVDALSEEHLTFLDMSSNVKPLMSGTSKAEQQQKQLNELMLKIGRLKALERLTMEKNELVTISSLGELTNLKTLSLCNNKLVSLPEDLWRLRQLKKLSVHGNRIREINTSIGQLESLESLDMKSNLLTYLPASIGQIFSLKHLDLSENQITQLVLSICDLALLEKIDVKGNPLQRPPIGIAKQGVPAIRRYFQGIATSGEVTSNAARLVLLGHGESGKTSLQRGLRAGCASPAEADERTIQLDIYSLLLGGTDMAAAGKDGAPAAPASDAAKDREQVIISMWDLAGQPQYAAGLQPYIVSGSLYLLLVPCMPVADLDKAYGDLVGRWMDYLTAGAPEAVVQPVLTHCDKMLPHQKDLSVGAFEAASTHQAAWVRDALARHQADQLVRDGFKPLRVQEKVLCVSCIEGGDKTIELVRQKLEEMVMSKPPLLPSVGQCIPKSWLQAMSFLRAVRDGRDPVLAARSAVPSAAEMERMERGGADSNAEAVAADAQAKMASGSGFAMGARPYMPIVEAETIWRDEVGPALNLEADVDVMHDALQLLVNQGEVFFSSGIIYLQPDYITRLLKPLVDHRLTRSRFQQTLGALPGDVETQARRAAMLLPACELFTKTGELREELLPPMWQPMGLHGDDYGDVVVMLSTSGVLFLAEHAAHGRRWVMPMRLPDARPADPYQDWQEMMLPAKNNEQLGVGYRLGRFAPPGISERLIAACNRLGEYNAFWKRGAILDTPVGPSSLLLEMRTTMVPGTVTGETHANHELCIEVRGPRMARSEMWLLLLRVQECTERLLEDFPGIYPEGLVYCPGCVKANLMRADGTPESKPTTWPIADAVVKRVQCEQCAESMTLHSLKLSRDHVRDARKELGLFITPPPMVVSEADDESSAEAPPVGGRRSAANGPGLVRTNTAKLKRQDSVNFSGQALREEDMAPKEEPSPPKADMKRSINRVMGVNLAAKGFLDGLHADGSDSASLDGSVRGSLHNDRASRDGSEMGDDSGAGLESLKARSSKEQMAAISNALAGQQGKLLDRAKFVAKAVRFGRPIEAGVGLHRLLGLSSEEELQKMKSVGESAIVEEITTADHADKDAAGYTDVDWLNYVKESLAEERKMPAGMPHDVLDEGHQLMRLDDFAADPIAAAAGLKRAHVLALRLYTTSVHRAINKPLVEGCSPQKPHPYPVTVFYICDALTRLRSAAEVAARADLVRAAGTSVGGIGGASPASVRPPGAVGADDAVAVADSQSTLWRGVADLHAVHEFKTRGATELGLVSCTSLRSVAEEYAIRPVTEEGGPLSVVLKVRADLSPGTDISWLATFPCEAECVYPPCTYLEARSSWDETVMLPSGDDLAIKVVEVVPRVGATFP